MSIQQLIFLHTFIKYLLKKVMKQVKYEVHTELCGLYIYSNKDAHTTFLRHTGSQYISKLVRVILARSQIT